MVDSALLTRSPRIANHARVGCSTGYMTDLHGDWPGLVERASSISTDAIELAALSEPELPGLIEYLASAPALPFQYVSLHGPSKGRELPEHELVELLDRLTARVDAVVVHPDTLEDLGVWSTLGRRIVIENMDTRKDRGQTADDLEEYFAALPDARLCFDIAHAWAVDPSMREGEMILDRFGARLRHLHVSSLDGDLHHVSLTREHEALFGPLLDRCRDVPWILEAAPRDD